MFEQPKKNLNIAPMNSAVFYWRVILRRLMTKQLLNLEIVKHQCCWKLSSSGTKLLIWQLAVIMVKLKRSSRLHSRLLCFIITILIVGFATPWILEPYADFYVCIGLPKAKSLGPPSITMSASGGACGVKLFSIMFRYDDDLRYKFNLFIGIEMTSLRWCAVKSLQLLKHRI